MGQALNTLQRSPLALVTRRQSPGGLLDLSAETARRNSSLDLRNLDAGNRRPSPVLYARTFNLASAGGNAQSPGQGISLLKRALTSPASNAATYRRLITPSASICKPINFNQQQQQQSTQQLGGLRVLGLNNRNTFIALNGGQTQAEPVQPQPQRTSSMDVEDDEDEEIEVGTENEQP